MTKLIIGFAISFAVGAFTRWFNLPVPAPPHIYGALLVLSTTCGYQLIDQWLTK